jgi:hypothetical protein
MIMINTLFSQQKLQLSRRLASMPQKPQAPAGYRNALMLAEGSLENPSAFPGKNGRPVSKSSTEKWCVDRKKNEWPCLEFHENFQVIYIKWTYHNILSTKNE